MVFKFFFASLWFRKILFKDTVQRDGSGRHKAHSIGRQNRERHGGFLEKSNRPPSVAVLWIRNDFFRIRIRIRGGGVQQGMPSPPHTLTSRFRNNESKDYSALFSGARIYSSFCENWVYKFGHRFLPAPMESKKVDLSLRRTYRIQRLPEEIF
jgi:hypothetical protein